MKSTRIAALVCFLLAGILYWVGSSSPADGVLLGLGVVFELAGWRRVLRRASP